METGDDPDWVPAISLVSSGVATQAGSVTAGGSVAVWIAGPAGTPVTLVWQRIDRGVWTAVTGAGGTVSVAVPVQPDPPGNGVIDADSAAAAATVNVDPPGPGHAQLLILAARLGGAKRLRSNPLIVSVRAAGPP
jgi:hypothetical protein